MTAAQNIDRVLLRPFRESHPGVRRAARAWLLIAAGLSTATAVAVPNDPTWAAATMVMLVFATAVAVMFDKAASIDRNYTKLLRNPRSRVDQLRGASWLLVGWCCSGVIPVACCTATVVACVYYPPARLATLVVLATGSAAWRMLRP